MKYSDPLFKCQTCGKYWSGKTTGCFEVNSEDGLIKCPECMTSVSTAETFPKFYNNNSC